MRRRPPRPPASAKPWMVIAGAAVAVALIFYLKWRAGQLSPGPEPSAPTATDSGR